MKPSTSRLLLRASAIGLFVCALYSLTFRVLFIHLPWFYLQGREVAACIYAIISLLSIAAACFVFYTMRQQQMVLSKGMRIFTYVLAGLYFLSLFGIRRICINGEAALTINARIQGVLSVITAVWLWMMSAQPQSDHPLSRSLSVILILGMVLPLANLLLMMISGVIYLFTDYPLNMSTYRLMTYLLFFIPLVLLGLYSCHLIRTQRGK